VVKIKPNSQSSATVFFLQKIVFYMQL